MGMLLRRKGRKPEVQPKVNGKPVVNPPKTKKLNKEPDYVKKDTVVNSTAPRF
ncbi:hypothetical protein IJE86_08175 [bacterium]|nr:hypothetical protein [bacterium]